MREIYLFTLSRNDLFRLENSDYYLFINYIYLKYIHLKEKTG